LGGILKGKLTEKQTIITVIIIAVTFNAMLFCLAYPEIFKPESENYARDFSAYYSAGWRLFHNPTKIYAINPQPGDIQILPKPQVFKYTPSFLIIVSPFLSLNYQDAMVIFDWFQLALIPFLGFFVYKLVKNKNVIIGSVAALIVLVEPLPTLAINLPPPQLTHIGFLTLNPQSFTPSYYCGYLFANAHVFQTVLLVGALYLASTKKPFQSGLLFAFGVFDPRGALVAFPLLLWYNRLEIRKFLAAASGFVLLTNLPFFFYYNIGLTFLRSEFNGNVATQMYAYDWIPIYAAVALTLVEVLPYIKTRFFPQLDVQLE
jgi:hypothetical protein